MTDAPAALGVTTLEPARNKKTAQDSCAASRNLVRTRKDSDFFHPRFAPTFTFD
jgi:hypothetical protein